MIIITKEQKDKMLTAKKKYQDKLLSQGADFVPIEIKGDLWTLPEEVLNDARFNDLKYEFDFYMREVKESEFIITGI